MSQPSMELAFIKEFLFGMHADMKAEFGAMHNSILQIVENQKKTVERLETQISSLKSVIEARGNSPQFPQAPVSQTISYTMPNPNPYPNSNSYHTVAPDEKALEAERNRKAFADEQRRMKAKSDAQQLQREEAERERRRLAEEQNRILMEQREIMRQQEARERQEREDTERVLRFAREEQEKKEREAREEQERQERMRREEEERKRRREEEERRKKEADEERRRRELEQKLKEEEERKKREAYQKKKQAILQQMYEDEEEPSNSSNPSLLFPNDNISMPLGTSVFDESSASLLQRKSHNQSNSFDNNHNNLSARRSSESSLFAGIPTLETVESVDVDSLLGIGKKKPAPAVNARVSLFGGDDSDSSFLASTNIVAAKPNSAPVNAMTANTGPITSDINFQSTSGLQTSTAAVTATVSSPSPVTISSVPNPNTNAKKALTMLDFKDDDVALFTKGPEKPISPKTAKSPSRPPPPSPKSKADSIPTPDANESLFRV